MRTLFGLTLPVLAALAFGCAAPTEALPTDDVLESTSQALTSGDSQQRDQNAEAEQELRSQLRSLAPAVNAVRYPIVLMPGMGGLDSFGPNNNPENYFPGVVQQLARAGEKQVFVLSVSPFNSSIVRAAEAEAQVRRILAQTGASKVNLVAHSQGGLDARYLASPRGRNFGAKIASITTISTPHRGTRVADLALAVVAGGFIEDSVNALLAFLQRTSGDLQTDTELRSQLRQLSTSYMNNDFNPRTPNAPGVRYESYAGRSNFQPAFGVCDGAALQNRWWEIDRVGLLMLPTAIFLEFGFPLVPNDGLVTVESSKWGQFVQCVPADHADEIGRGESNQFSHLAFYQRIVARIRANGS